MVSGLFVRTFVITPICEKKREPRVGLIMSLMKSKYLSSMVYSASTHLLPIIQHAGKRHKIVTNNNNKFIHKFLNKTLLLVTILCRLVCRLLNDKGANGDGP